MVLCGWEAGRCRGRLEGWRAAVVATRLHSLLCHTVFSIWFVVAVKKVSCAAPSWSVSSVHLHRSPEMSALTK